MAIEKKTHTKDENIDSIINILIFCMCSSTGKPIKEHRLIVSAVKQVISPGIGFGK